jgi:hypothetical protein
VTQVAAPPNGRSHVTGTLLGYATERAQPRRRLTSVRAAVTSVCRTLAPYVLTTLALTCGVAAAFTWRPAAGLLAAMFALLLLELRVHIETRPDPPAPAAEPAPRTYG